MILIWWLLIGIALGFLIAYFLELFNDVKFIPFDRDGKTGRCKRCGRELFKHETYCGECLE